MLASAGELPPLPTRHVTDQSGLLTEPVRASLDERLGRYEARTGHQLLIWIAPDFGDLALEDFTNRTFRAWKVGRKDKNDGLVLFVFTTPHKSRIEVGYGLEEKIPDVVASRVLREALAPAMRAGSPEQGLNAAMEAICSTIGEGELDGAAQGGTRPSYRNRKVSQGDDASPLFLFIIFGVLILIAYLRFKYGGGWHGGGGGWSSGGWGGGSSWGSSDSSGGGSDWGSFSGGGGDSGGGGASGDW
jgi:uncharacterized protein